MNLTPRGIREHLGLNRPIYAPQQPMVILAAPLVRQDRASFSWEATDLVDKLASAAK